jgi:hypothetical protein
MNPARSIVTWVVFLALPSVCLASGWNDYELDIGDGYRIVKCNSLEVILTRKDGPILIMPRPNDSVGPIAGYCVTAGRIFTKNHGRTCRFQGDPGRDIDTTTQFYFIVSKADDKVTGPLSEAEFARHSAVVRTGTIDWKRPRNPNILLPLAGSLFFLTFALPFLAIRYWWVSVPLLFALYYWLVNVRGKRKPT